MLRHEDVHHVGNSGETQQPSMSNRRQVERFAVICMSMSILVFAVLLLMNKRLLSDYSNVSCLHMQCPHGSV